MKKLLTTTLLASTLLASTAFSADQNKNKRFGKGNMGPAKIYRKLDLTDTQEKQIKAIFDSVRPNKEKANMKADFKAKMQARRSVIEAKTLDMAAVNKIADEQATRAKERFVKMIEAEHKAWQVLTPEQQAKAKKMMEKRAERMEKRMENGDDRPPMPPKEES